MTGAAAAPAPAAGRYDDFAWQAVDGILAAGAPLAVAVTGGGSRAVSWLLNHPGASRVMVEAQVPYSAAAVDDYLGVGGPHRAVEETARRLAARARQRARRLAAGEAALGVGATAALATDRARKGADRAFVCTRSGTRYTFLGLDFDRGAAGRLEQEEVLSAVLVGEVAAAAGAATGSPSLPAWAAVQRAAAVVDEAVESLLDGGTAAVEIADVPDEDGAAVDVAAGAAGERILVPGSFNPLHAGHTGLAEAAQRRSGRQACFELSVDNVDKDPLPYRQVLARARQDRGGRPLLLTRAPTFLDKAQVFPGCWFAIGYDTAVRLVQPKYYDGSRAHMDSALARLRDLGARFLVAGRHWEGAWSGLDQVPVPDGFDDLFDAIPEEDFRVDVSSTQLRQKGGSV